MEVNPQKRKVGSGIDEPETNKQPKIADGEDESGKGDGNVTKRKSLEAMNFIHKTRIIDQVSQQLSVLCILAIIKVTPEAFFLTLYYGSDNILIVADEFKVGYFESSD